jgi:8-oxo-dGTP pyrophosphatase MutT (NUDIX family)
MRYGISAAGLIVQDERVLLVNHTEPGRYDFWLPPGGSLEGSESIFDCARRETFEETGLTVELGHILYIQEFWEPEYHFCKFFITCKAFSGSLSAANRGEEERWLVDARFFARDDLRGIAVHPEILRDQFWEDLKAEHLVTKYLGIERMRY